MSIIHGPLTLSMLVGKEVHGIGKVCQLWLPVRNYGRLLITPSTYYLVLNASPFWMDKDSLGLSEKTGAMKIPLLKYPVASSILVFNNNNNNDNNNNLYSASIQYKTVQSAVHIIAG